MDKIINIVEEMKSHRVANYAIAGLDSYLLEKGKVRLFKNSRDHQDQLTPHSHRFDFTCLVLQGHVINRVWVEGSTSADQFQMSQLTYDGEIGEHTKKVGDVVNYRYMDTKYEQGNMYSMSADQIHSITFSKGAIVLFFEGPQLTDTSKIIEPVVDGRVIPTYEKKDYMFIKAHKDD